MRSPIAILLLAVATAPATAQLPRPAPVPAAEPAPAMQTPLDTLNALTQARRQALQSDLAWTGTYNGMIDGDVGERTINAIRAFQGDRYSQATGALNPQERERLAALARQRKAAVGWTIVGDPETGMRTGLPLKLVPKMTRDAAGTHWSAPAGAIEVTLSRRQQADLTADNGASRERTTPAGRTVEYSTVKADGFVLSGSQDTKKLFYVRGQVRGDEVRTLTVLYDRSMKARMDPVVIAMSSAFDPFPAGALAVGPPPRKSVDYATGIVVSSTGAIVADRHFLEGCQSIVIAGHGNADKVAEDKQHGLALLRFYGARGLSALAIGDGPPAIDVDLTGIADPQDQSGGAAVSSLHAAVGPASEGEAALTPAPGSGFSGAAAMTADGRFAGMVRLKPRVAVAGPANSVSAAQATLTPATTVLAFLTSHGVTADSRSADAKAAVVRVICVRK